MWYFVEHGIPRVEEAIQTHERVLEDGTIQCYATFVCPITKTEYFSGTLPHQKNYRILDDISASASASAMVALENQQEQEDDAYTYATEPARQTPIIVAYKLPELAQKAVAGRVLDILRYQASENLQPRFCLEDPSNGKAVLDKEEEEEEEEEEEVGEPEQNNDFVLKEMDFTNYDMGGDNNNESTLPDKGWPTLLLNIFYGHKHGIFNVTDNLNVKVNKKTGHCTATFVCPLTDEQYKAGSFRYARSGIPDDHDNTSAGDDDDDNDNDNVVYYLKKSDAKAAAAARVLDLIQYKTTGQVEPRFCDEDPSQADNPVAIVKVITETDKGQLPKVQEQVNGMWKEQQPVAELNLHYLNGHTIYRAGNSIQTERVSSDPAGWTASFVCPVTNTEYKAGILHSRKEDIIRCDLPADDDRILYMKKNSAKAAAAGRTMDVIHFHQTGATQPRYCEEDPSENAKIVPVEEAKPSLFSALAEIEYAETAGSDEDSDENEEPPVLQEVEQSSLLAGYTDRDQEGEFVVTQIERGPLRRPLDRILEAVASEIDSSYTHVLPNMPREGTSVETLLEAQNNAFAHLKMMWQADSSKEFKSPHRFVLPQSEDSNALLVSKSLLARLAKAHQSIDRPPEGLRGVEKAAALILEYLWKTEHCKPDAETYSYFIQCLEGPNPLQIAKRAESIVHNLNRGGIWKGNDLPKPSVRTINTLIQLKAQSGERLERVEDLDIDFEPNAETFMCLLSSSAYIPYNVDEKRPRFDINLARQCIERLKTIKGISKDDLTAACNAPLRWSGGHLARVSRPYARPTPFDDYGELYKNGLNYKPVDKFMEEAKAYEDWVEEFKHVASIETYEALIQCWLRTKTADGIKRADEIARMLLADPKLSGLRPLTLHPLLAAWLHAKHEDSASKLRYWIEHLTVTSDDFPQLVPDGRMVGALISASAWKGESLLNISSGNNEYPSSLSTDLLDMARVCTDQLELHCSRFQTSLSSNQTTDVFVEVSLFVDCLATWQSALIAAANKQTESNFDIYLDGFYQVLSLFERTVEALSEEEDIRLGSDSVPSIQLRHILEEGDSVLLAFLGALSKADIAINEQLKDELDGGNCSARSLDWIERAIRRVGEMYETRTSWSELGAGNFPDDQEGQNPRRELAYGDLFHYGKLQPEDPADKARLIDVGVKVLEKVPLDCHGAIGDVVRISLLVKEICAAHRRMTETRGSIDKQFDPLLLSCQQAIIRSATNKNTDESQTRTMD